MQYDTIEVEFVNEETGEDSSGTEIEEYTITERDTQYVSPEGVFKFNFPVPDALSGEENYCEQLPAYLRLRKDGNGCILELRQVVIANCEGMFAKIGDKKEVAFVKESFEKGLIGPLKRAD